MKSFIRNSVLLILILPFFSCGQSFNGRTVLGEKNARGAIENALATKDNKPFYDTLIKEEETAIAVAEPILFKIYGKKNITDQKPYESYLVDGYWYICGTLPKDWKGVYLKLLSVQKMVKLLN